MKTMILAAAIATAVLAGAANAESTRGDGGCVIRPGKPKPTVGSSAGRASVCTDPKAKYCGRY